MGITYQKHGQNPHCYHHLVVTFFGPSFLTRKLQKMGGGGGGGF